METQIKFGTDGWRGRMADDYTFDNVRRCAQGFAAYSIDRGLVPKGVVGHNNWFQIEAVIQNASLRELTTCDLTLNFGELVKRCRLFCGGNFRPRPGIARIVRHIG